MGRVSRYVVTAFAMDFTIYVALSVAAAVAEKNLGAGPFELGLIAVFWGVSYTVNAVFFGRISDRMSRTTLMRIGLLLVIGVCLFFTRVTHLFEIYLGVPFIALGMGCFWPSLQAAIADESGPANLTRNLGAFNVTWSLGKGFGVLFGGHLAGLLGTSAFYAAAGVGALLFVFLPRVPRGGGHGIPLLAEDEPRPKGVREGFRISALLANFAAFGLATTILVHYPEWNAELLRGPADYGNVVGGVFLAQTLSFLVLLRFKRWHYRAAPLLVSGAGAAIAVAMLGTALPLVALLPFLLLAGNGLGIAYYSAIYYSLHSDTARGRRAGLHEAIIGTGHFVVPLLGGVVARWTGAGRAPYLVAGAVVLLCLSFEMRVLLRHRVG